MKNLQRFLPFLRWFPMTGETIKADLIAGITVALVLIPQSMAYAQLAGLPPYYGLYAAFLPVIVGALWGSSSQLSTGPVAVVSLLTATTVVQFAKIGSPEFVSLVIMLTFLVGFVQLVLGILKLGVIVNFLSHPVIVGFTNAAAMIIAFSQFSKIFGVPMQRSEHFLLDVWDVITKIGDTHLLTLAFGLTAFIVMLFLRKKYPKVPGVLIAVVISILVSWTMDFQNQGGKIVGVIPEGLPSLGIPTFNMILFWDMAVSALLISFIGFMEAISIAKAMSAKTKERINPNQELIGQGLANIIGSLSQSYPASGSFSRSAVNINAGAVTGMSSVFTAIIVTITLLFLTPLLYHLPQAVLAAVIMVAAFGLIDFKSIKHAWHVSKHDGIAAIIAFFATLGFAPHLEKGIMLGAGLSIVLYLYRTMKPRVAILGRYKDGTLRDIQIHKDLPTSETVVAIRFDGSLYFANVSYFEDIILKAVSENLKAKYILIVGDGINQLDASGEDILHQLNNRLRKNGITLVFSGLKRQIFDVLRASGLLNVIGTENFYATEEMALEYIYKKLDEDPEVESDYRLLRPSV
jgi:SulP family sulfate permease